MRPRLRETTPEDWHRSIRIVVYTLIAASGSIGSWLLYKAATANVTPENEASVEAAWTIGLAALGFAAFLGLGWWGLRRLLNR